MTKDDVLLNVSITADLLTVKGERRQLAMPAQAGKVKATYRDGVLTVKLPKADEVTPKEVKIDIL